MAKLFGEEEEEEVIIEPKENSAKIFKGFLLGIFINIIFLIVFLITVVLVKEEKRRDSNNKNNSMSVPLIEVIKVKKGNILTQEVKYTTFKKTDPKDTSDIYFEVIIGDEEYPKGCLIKFAHRFYQPQQIEGTIYCVIDTEQIQFNIPKEHVKESLLKR